MAQNKILIVEDDLLLQEGYALALQAEDFKVLKANDGKQGLEIALQEKPDLILLDILMPIMGGLEMLEKLRQDQDYGKTARVVLLTNLFSSNEDIAKKITQTEPIYYMMKSGLTFREVVENMKEILA